MTDCVIFDLDGTLADVRHRLHHVKGGATNWDAFFAALRHRRQNGSWPGGLEMLWRYTVQSCTRRIEEKD